MVDLPLHMKQWFSPMLLIIGKNVIKGKIILNLKFQQVSIKQSFNVQPAFMSWPYGNSDSLEILRINAFTWGITEAIVQPCGAWGNGTSITTWIVEFYTRPNTSSIQWPQNKKLKLKNKACFMPTFNIVRDWRN